MITLALTLLIALRQGEGQAEMQGRNQITPFRASIATTSLLRAHSAESLKESEKVAWPLGPRGGNG